MIRSGDGKGRKFLIIDQQTETEMKARVSCFISLFTKHIYYYLVLSLFPPLLSLSLPTSLSLFSLFSLSLFLFSPLLSFSLLTSFSQQNEPFNSENAIVMVARSPSDRPASSISPPNLDDILDVIDGPSSPVSNQGISESPKPRPLSFPEPSSTAGLNLDMQAARPQKKGTKRAQVKQQDWRAAIKAYNEL